MQERSRIPDDPAESRPEASLEGWTSPEQPGSGIKARRDVHDAERATEEGPATLATDEVAKNPAAVALGRLGGKKGGKARAARMTATERSDAARRAAIARWAEKDGK